MGELYGGSQSATLIMNPEFLPSWDESAQTPKGALRDLPFEGIELVFTPWKNLLKRVRYGPMTPWVRNLLGHAPENGRVVWWLPERHSHYES